MVELVVAMTVLMLAVVSLAQLMMATTVGTLRTRIRQTAVAEANARIEGFRAADYTNLALRTGAGVPTTYVGGDGTTYSVLQSAAGTVTYQQNITAGRFPFRLTQIVAKVDDPADGLGALDKDTNTTDYKKVFVELASTTATPAFVYTIESVLHDVTKDPVVGVQGVHVEVLDASQSPYELAADEDLAWSVDISGGAGVNGDRTSEGIYNNFQLPAGLYDCTIRLTASTNAWHPLSNSAATFETLPCNVTAGAITTIQTRWVDTGCTATGGPGELRVGLTNDAGGPAANVTVTLTGKQSQPTLTRTTGPDGIAVFANAAAGGYDVATSGGGYMPANGSTCVPAEDTTTVAMSVDTAPITATLKIRLVQNGHSSTVRIRVSPTVFADFTLNKAETQTMTINAPTGTYAVTGACVRSDGREDTKVSFPSLSVVAGATYLLPGPADTNTAAIKC